MLTPEDFKNKTFSKGFRGYEVEEVDKFLKTLLKEYEYLYLDNLEQKETIERVSSKLEYYQQMEATMQSTLTVAQETADELKASSEKKNIHAQLFCLHLSSAANLVSISLRFLAQLFAFSLRRLQHVVRLRLGLVIQVLGVQHRVVMNLLRSSLRFAQHIGG